MGEYEVSDDNNLWFCLFFFADVDILSMGSLSQGVPHVDFSLKIKKAV